MLTAQSLYGFRYRQSRLPQTQYRWQGFAPCMIRFTRWAKALHTNLYVVPMSNLTYERLPVPPQRYLKTQKSTDCICFIGSDTYYTGLVLASPPNIAGVGLHHSCTSPL